MTIRFITECVAEVFEVSVEDLRGPARHRSICVPRHFCFGLLRKHTDKSYPEIGRFFGGRDHTTVLHGERRFNDQWAHEFRDQILHLESLIIRATVFQSRRAPSVVLSFPQMKQAVKNERRRQERGV